LPAAFEFKPNRARREGQSSELRIRRVGANAARNALNVFAKSALAFDRG
jgi:hypothetical protein